MRAPSLIDAINLLPGWRALKSFKIFISVGTRAARRATSTSRSERVIQKSVVYATGMCSVRADGADCISCRR